MNDHAQKTDCHIPAELDCSVGRVVWRYDDLVDTDKTVQVVWSRGIEPLMRPSKLDRNWE